MSCDAFLNFGEKASLASGLYAQPDTTGIDILYCILHWVVWPLTNWLHSADMTFFLRWELLDDPFRSSICSCCDSTCSSRSKRWADWGNAFLPNEAFCAGGFFASFFNPFFFFFPCQDPTALVTNLFWDPWSSWIRLTRRPTTYHRCLALRCIDELFISRSLQSPDMCLKVLNIFLAGKPGVTWWRLCDCAQQRPVQDGLRLLAY